MRLRPWGAFLSAIGILLSAGIAAAAPAVTLIAKKTESETFLSLGIAGNGASVCFGSNSSTLVPGDTNGKFDVFVWRLLNKKMTLVSQAQDGTPSNDESGGSSSGGCGLSFDGRYVGFATHGDTIHPDLETKKGGIVVVDLRTGTRSAMSLPVTDPGNDRYNYHFGGISDNGRFVFFQAKTEYPGQTVTYKFQWYLWDRVGDTVTLITKSPDGAPGNSSAPGGEHYGSISPNGRLLHFTSFATNLTSKALEDGVSRYFLYDTRSGKTRSSYPKIMTPDGTNYYFFVSEDGLYVRNVKTKRQRRVEKFQGEGAGPNSSSRTGRYLTLMIDYQMNIFDTRTKKLASIAGATRVLSAILSRSGKEVFYQTETGLYHQKLRVPEDS